MLDLRGARWDAPPRRTSPPTERDGSRTVRGELRREKVGLGVAVDYCLDIGVDRIWARVARISESLRRELDAVPGVTVRDVGETRCGIVTFDVEGATPAEVRAALAERGVNVWTSRVMNNTRLEGRGENRRGRDAGGYVVRASAHYFNADWEVEKPRRRGEERVRYS